MFSQLDVDVFMLPAFYASKTPSRRVASSTRSSQGLCCTTRIRSAKTPAGRSRASSPSYGIICSMSGKGNGRDNSPSESWFNSQKNEPPV